MKSGLLRGLIGLLAASLALFSIAAAESEGIFDYKLLDDGSAMITGYKGSESDLVFPEYIEGHPVSALGRNFSARTVSVKGIRSMAIPNTMITIEPGALFFAGNLTDIRIAEDHPVMLFADGALYNRKEQSLLHYLQGNTAEHFDVPDGIRTIEDRAFYRAKLVSIRLPGSVESIGTECFDQCFRLMDVTLEEGLKAIGKDAFANCDQLRKIVIPASVSDIEEAAFTDNHLQEIRIADGSSVFAVSDGALINMRDGVLIAYPEYSEAESCVIPEGVTRIGSFAFYRSHHLKRITFPDGLLEIGRGAFLSCNHLTAIDIPDTVIMLEESAFGGNSDAEQLHIPAGLTEIVNNFNDLGISELKIPETVTAIRGSFCSLRNLAEAVIPYGVDTVSQGSFAFCRNLASITIPDSVSNFSCTFVGCAGTLVIRAAPGGCVEQYCREHHMNYEAMTE